MILQHRDQNCDSFVVPPFPRGVSSSPGTGDSPVLFPHTWKYGDIKLLSTASSTPGYLCTTSAQARMSTTFSVGFVGVSSQTSCTNPTKTPGQRAPSAGVSPKGSGCSLGAAPRGLCAVGRGSGPAAAGEASAGFLQAQGGFPSAGLAPSQGHPSWRRPHTARTESFPKPPPS